MEIDDYIKLSRTRHANDKILNTNKDLLNEFKDVYPDAFDVNFKAIATLEKESSILKVNGKNFLLFDLYLLRELANLNSILFYENLENTRLGVIYSFKTMAENLLFRREYTISNRFIDLHNGFMRNIVSASPAELITEEVTVMTNIQGKYVAAHEYGHLIFDRQDSTTIDITKDRFKDFIRKQFPKDKLNDKYEEKARREHIKIMNEAHRKNHSVLPNDGFRMPIKELAEKLDLLIDDDDLLEEMICDEIALEILFRACDSDSYEITATSAVVFLYNLRYFAIADRYSYGLIEPKTINNIFFSIDIRIRSLTDFSHAKIEEMNGKTIAIKWLNDLKNIEDVHLKKITYQMMFPAWTALKKEFNKKAKERMHLSLEEELSLRNTIIQKIR